MAICILYGFYVSLGSFGKGEELIDRLYAATEVGIQTVISFGIVDVILDNPAGKMVDKLEIGEEGYLYAQAAGKTYKRKLENAKRTAYDVQTPPVCMEYFN